MHYLAQGVEPGEEQVEVAGAKAAEGEAAGAQTQAQTVAQLLAVAQLRLPAVAQQGVMVSQKKLGQRSLPFLQ